MRKIAIIGAGQAGLLTAHGLLQAGYDVTLYSNRSAEQFLNDSRPTGTACRFGPALDYERELGLNHWDNIAPAIEGVYLAYAMQPRIPFINLSGHFSQTAAAIDLRLQSHRWMNDFEAQGGTIRIETVDINRLDEIAAENDLTILATGKADLTQIFERNEARSVYHEPQRNLAMVIVKNVGEFERIPFKPVKFNFVDSIGESFIVPYHHKDNITSWNLVFEAKPGSRMDKFQNAKSGEEMVQIAKDVIKDLFPWDYDWFKSAELADAKGSLKGRITPSIRNAVGTLPSGRKVTGVGDALMALDPIGGQGANNGNRMSKHLVRSIIQRGEAAFDARWMHNTFEKFYAQSGEMTVRFNNLLLEPLPDGAKQLLITQYGSDGISQNAKQAIADAFCDNFADPHSLTPLFTDSAKAHAFIKEKSHRPWMLPAANGFYGLVRDQIRQKVGANPVAGYW